MKVVVVDLGDMGVRDNDEGQVPQSLDAAGQPGREEREGEVCRCKKGISRERRPAMSKSTVSALSASPFTVLFSFLPPLTGADLPASRADGDS